MPIIAFLDIGPSGQYGILGFLLFAIVTSAGLTIRLVRLGNEAFVEPAKETIQRLQHDNLVCQRENRVLKRTVDGLIRHLQRNVIDVPSWVWEEPEATEPPVPNVEDIPTLFEEKRRRRRNG